MDNLTIPSPSTELEDKKEDQVQLGTAGLKTPAVFQSVEPIEPPAIQTSVDPKTLRRFGDPTATRKILYEKVFEATKNLPPVSNKTHTLRLKDVHWKGSGSFTKKQRRDAQLKMRSLNRGIRGTWELVDNATGEVIDRATKTVLRVPYLTNNNTIINNGAEYAIRNQQRLRAGIYAREKDNGELESFVNVLKGGPTHRYSLDRSKGVFYAHINQAKIPMLPLLEALGASKDDIKKAWGDELYRSNVNKRDGGAIEKYKARLLNPAEIELAGGDVRKALKAKFEQMEIEPEISKYTLGKPHKTLNSETILDATSKLLKIVKGEADQDDRDQLAFQTFHGPEDMFAERLIKDRAGLQRQLLFKATQRGSLKSMPSSALQKQLMSLVIESGLGEHLDGINPAEILDRNTQVTRMGEGGIGSSDAIPDSSRNVQPSQTGFIDLIRTPESGNAGVDTYLASATRKGQDGKLYTRFRDPVSGKNVWKSPYEIKNMVLAFPGELSQDKEHIAAMEDGKFRWAKRDEIDLELPNMEDSFSPLANMVPLKGAMKGQRLSMAARMLTQALPLVAREAPLVQSAIPGTQEQKSYEERYAKTLGAIRARQAGQVVSVNGNKVKLKYNDGTTGELDLYQNHLYNSKTYNHQTPVVKPGDRFAPGDLLATSNFTDNTGTSALGLNARVAFTSFGGLNFEDGIVISESMAKRLSSQHMYKHRLEKTPRTSIDKRKFIAQFPSKYTRDQLSKFDDNGLIKAGTKVEYGDPIILGVEQADRVVNKVHRKGQAAYKDVSLTWDKKSPGVVTDVVEGKNGPVALVKSVRPAVVADKLSARAGNKGVISAIIPDSRMPHDSEGRPFEVILNPASTPSRINPNQIMEAALGKLARKLGRPIKIEDFDLSKGDYAKHVSDLLKKHNIPTKETIFDPDNDTSVEDVATGEMFFMKLHHQSEDKNKVRAGGGYDAENTPSGDSKRLGLLETNALLSAGAINFVRGTNAIRGQRNDDYWLQFMQGNRPADVKVPMVYKKFINRLRGAGINVAREGSKLNVMAMTNDDVKKLAGGRYIDNGETVRFDKNMAPIPGGLFDPKIFGRGDDARWGAIKLPAPMLNPVMEEPTRRLLGLTQKEFQAVMAGQQDLNGATGPQAITKGLESIDVDKAIRSARAAIRGTNKSKRDAAVRRLGYLKTLKRQKMSPKDWVLDSVPVLPPQFRPVSTLGSKNLPMVSDPNYLYKDLMATIKNQQELASAVGEDNTYAEQLGVYNAFKAVTGLGSPVTQKSQEKNVKGLLRSVFGAAPKYSTVQRQLLSTKVDNVGRSVITPNPNLDMDSIGIPKDKAFDLYKRFIVRRLRRQGMPITRAMQAVKDRTNLAEKALQEELDARPMVASRAPTLHRFGIMGFRPRLVKGNTLQISPLVVGGFNADFDGDTMNYHIPATDEEVNEVYERMLPSKMLISPADFKRPVHLPGQEYVGGLFTATSPLMRRRGPAKTFNTKAEVVAAARAGKLDPRDRVIIRNA